MIDLSDYYSGGYFLIRADKPDWESLQTEQFPNKLISLSNCLCLRLSVHWGWQKGYPSEELSFGIPKTKLSEFVEWCHGSYPTDIDFDSMFVSLDAARRFVACFLPDTHNLYLIGVGLHRELAETAWYEYPDETSEVYGVALQIDKHLSLADGGTILGFEVASFTYGTFGHSWLCSGLEKEMHELFGIRPGPFGLLQSRDDAQRVNDWIAEDPTHRGEPEPYAYWLLVSYPLSDTAG